MELHQLRYFVQVAETGSFSRAAEQCHVSQPALSQQIQKLERQFGRPLLHRLGRRAVLTDAGRMLLERATAILASVDDTELRLKGFDALAGGRLAVGAIPTVGPYLLPAALKRFAARYPGVELSVHEDLTENLVRATAAGDLDLAVVALPVGDDRLSEEPLLTEPLLLALPPGHRLLRRRRPTIDDLRDERFILLSEMHCLGEQLQFFCRAGGCQRIACRSTQLSTIQSLIAMGQGVSLLPAMAARADRSGRLAYRPLTGPPPTRTVGVVWHKQRYHSAAAERFLARLRELAAGAEDHGGKPRGSSI